MLSAPSCVNGYSYDSHNRRHSVHNAMRWTHLDICMMQAAATHGQLMLSTTQPMTHHPVKLLQADNHEVQVT